MEDSWHLPAVFEKERKTLRRTAVDQRVVSITLGKEALELDTNLWLACARLLDISGTLICGEV
jgi:hypothetical protein